MSPPRLIPFESRQPRNYAAPSPLSIRGLSVAYDDKPAVWDLDYDAPDRALIAVIGPNGAGKSTMIKAMLGLVPALAGDVRIFGSKLRQARRRIAYIPQRTSVDWDFPASAEDVVAMGLYGEIGCAVPCAAVTATPPATISTGSAWPILQAARSASFPADSSSGFSLPVRLPRKPIST